ncbi:MAG: hypothetical protein EOM20_08395 [Spartobacteria bacterium]|nr:hypothetical protein [Spartobacteria bacterium]
MKKKTTKMTGKQIARTASALVLGSTLAASAGWGAKGGASKPTADAGYEALEQTFSSNQEKYRDLVKKLEGTITEAQDKLTRLRAERDDLNDAIKDLERENRDLIAARNEQRAELEGQLKASEEVANEFQKQKELMTAVEARLKELTGRIPVYESALQSEKQLAEIRKSMEAMKADFARQLDEKDSAMASVKTELNNQKADYTEAEKKIRNVVTESGKIEQALRGTEMVIASLTAKLEIEQKKASVAEKSYRDMERTYGKMEAELVKERSDRLALQEQTTKQNELLNQIESELAQIRKEKESAIAEARSSLELLESFLAKHQELLGTLQRKRDDITTVPAS